MKIVVLYRPVSEHASGVEEFIRAYQSRRREDRIERLNIDSRDGMATAALYDVVQNPAILVLRNDGGLQNMWQGETLPRVDDVLGYAQVGS